MVSQIELQKIQSHIKQGITSQFVAAIVNGKNDIVLAYLENGVNPNKEYRGSKPLYLVIIHANIEALPL